METKQTSKKALLTSGLSVAVSAALLVGTTFAWFTDSVTSQNNKIQAGRLDVTLSELSQNGGYQEVGDGAIFDYDFWEPGYSDAAAFKIANNGSLALKYQFDIVTKDNSADASKLAEVIDVYYRNDNATGESTTLPGSADTDGMVWMGTLADVLEQQNNGVAYGYLEKGEADYATIALKMKETAGNEYQKLSVGGGFDIILKATQYTSETDGFGSKDYDAAATYPVVTEAEFLDAIANAPAGSTIALSSDLVIDEVLNINKDITIEGNGATLTNTSLEKDTLTVTGGNVTIKGCNVKNYSGYQGIKILNSAGEVTVENCTFNLSKGHSVWINGGQKVTVTGCEMNRPINLNGEDNLTSNVTISNNIFKTSIWDVYGITLAGDLKDIDIYGNTFVNAFRLYNLSLDNVNIHDNTYTAGWMNFQGDSESIYNQAKQDGQIIETNNTEK